MKFGPKAFFILSAVLGAVFFVLLVLKIDFMTYAFLGGAIGSCWRGFYEQSKQKE